MLQVVHESLRERRAAAATPAPDAAAPTSSTASGEGAAAAGVELSADDRDALLSVRDGLRCQARHERNWAGGRATAGARAGRVYYEVKGGAGGVRGGKGGLGVGAF
jgi:hypothetical protein